MKKLILLSLLTFALQSCKEQPSDYYAGFVVDETGKPIENVLVKETSGSLETKTGKNGFFKLLKDKSITCHLKLEKEGYKSDTISTFDVITNPNNWEDAEIVYSSILKSDTTKIVLHIQ